MWICDNVRMKINEDKNNSSENPICPCCGGSVKKFGTHRNVNGIVQRYQCLVCGKTFSDKQPVDGLRVDTDKVWTVKELLTAI
jgi:rubredoxin